MEPPPPSKHEFYIGVTNNTGKTIRQVGIRVISANIPNRPMNFDLRDKNTERPKIDIPPKLTDLFRLGAVMRQDESNCIDQHKVMDKETMASVAALANRHKKCLIGLIMPHAQGKEELLRNDGQILHVVAHGDDVDPAHALVVLNMKGEISVEVRSIASLDIDDATSDRL